MAIAQIQTRVSADTEAQVHAGNVVSIRLQAQTLAYQMTAETSSPGILRLVAREITIWVRALVPGDIFRLEMCYYPVFLPNGDLDSLNSLWAQVGLPFTTTVAQPIASQTVTDMAYAIRVVRITAGGVPQAGNFEVYAWYLKG